MRSKTTNNQKNPMAPEPLPSVNLMQYGIQSLEDYRDHLQSLCVPDANATISYDILAGTLIWSDETSNSTPTDVIHALRGLRHYRMRMMLQGTEPDIEVWRYCKMLFPNWNGFRPDRYQPTPELLARYRRGDIESRWCLRKLERELDAE